MKAILRMALPLLAIAVAATLVLGAKPDTIRAPHPAHLANGVECATCHAADSSKAGTDNLLPTMETCGTCHDIQNPENCKQCHTNVEAPGQAVRVTTIAQKLGTI